MFGENNKVSIIIPVYNGARYIGEAVESALRQTYKGLEVIVIDDGSTDNTREVLQPYIEKGLIKYIRQSNSGPATARNKGILSSDGKYLTLLDSDDVLMPDCLALIVAFMEKHGELGFVFTNYDLFDEHGLVNESGVDIWKIFRKIPHVEMEPGHRRFTENLTKYIIQFGGFMHTSGLTIRRSVLNQSGLFRDGYFYSEDNEFYARVTYVCQSGYIDRVLSRKRNHPDSIIHDRSKSLRNVLHSLQLTEIQKEYFREDREIDDILNQKLPGLVFDCCWGLQDRGELKDAQKMLCGYLKKYKRAWPLYRLLARNCLLKLSRRLSA